MSEFVSSRRNQWVKQLLDAQRGKGDWAEFCFPEGVKLCEEARRADLKIEAVFSAVSLGWDVPEQYGDESTKRFVLSAELFSQISATKSPQGLLLVCAKPQWGEMSDLILTSRRESRDHLSILVLESVQDPGNVGTMLRSSYALGFDACVLCGTSADPYQSKALRAAMGAAFHLPLYVQKESSKIIEWCQSQGISVVAAALNGVSLPDYKRDVRASLWIGNEGRGLSAEVLEQATTRLTIPMPGGAESLNAASAAAILMYRLQEEVL